MYSAYSARCFGLLLFLDPFLSPFATLVVVGRNGIIDNARSKKRKRKGKKKTISSEGRGRRPAGGDCLEQNE